MTGSHNAKFTSIIKTIISNSNLGSGMSSPSAAAAKPSVKRDNCGMLAALDAGRGKIVRSREAFGFQEILVVSERANHAQSEMWIQDSGHATVCSHTTVSDSRRGAQA